ncbi:GDP-fucose protein O-fucosyltransferase 2-like isoform X2 [Lineus longissimus]
MSILVKNLNKDEPWTLVVPPWNRLYHWQSRDIEQNSLPWSSFFEMESFNRHVPVIEFEEFNKISNGVIDELYYLQHYKEGWGKDWEEKMHERPCIDRQYYKQDKSGRWHGYFWDYHKVYAKIFQCISIQGHASFIIPFLQKNTTGRSVFINRAESLLHDTFGGKDYWEGRRSMRFAKHLREVGDKFRSDYLDSTDEKDNTVLDPDWRNMRRKHGDAKGGPYIGVHLRRADFLRVRENEVPSIQGAAKTLKKLLKEYKLKKVFIATDGTREEYSELKKDLKDYEVFRYQPTESELQQYKDGGVAIIDQWICAHARYSIGSHESTFSFRIQDEREILGFLSKTSFNRFCPDDKNECEQPAKWTIVY